MKLKIDWNFIVMMLIYLAILDVYACMYLAHTIRETPKRELFAHDYCQSQGYDTFESYKYQYADNFREITCKNYGNWRYPDVPPIT